MSADQITKSIRRIVRGLEDDPIGLSDADEYKSIGTSRGEAFINSRGDVTGSASEGSDDKEEKPSSTTPPTDNPDDNDTGGEGGTNTGEDPVGALAGDVDDVDDAIDTASQIGTLTGTDPATGNFTSLNLNTLEGIEYVPPVGWDSPESEQFPEVYVGEEINNTNACSILSCPAGNTLGSTGKALFDTNTGITWVLKYIDLVTVFPPPGYTSTGPCVGCGPAAPPDESINGPFKCFSVAASEPEPVDTTQPWPTDGTCQVVFDEAAEGYKGNAKDPDCSADQKLPTDFVIIRSVSDPSKFFRYTRLANGGTKITQVDSGGTPVPGTITKTTDAGGRVDGFFDVSLDAGIK